MKRPHIAWIGALIAVALMTQAFQCGSPEFTGAKVYIQQKNYKEAVRLLEAETQKNPGNEEAWYLLGLTKGKDLDDYVGMNMAFNAALKLSNVHQREIHALRYQKWVDHLNEGVNLLNKAMTDSSQYYDKSIHEFNRAIEAWSDTSLTYRYLGHAYNSKGVADSAITAYTKAWDLGQDKEAYMRAGRLYTQRGLDLKSKFETDNAEKLHIMRGLADIDRGSYKNDVMQALGAPDNVKKGPKNSKKEEWTYAKYNLTLVFEGDRVLTKTMSKPYDAGVDSTAYHNAEKEFSKAIAIFEKIKEVDPKDNQNLSLLLQAYVESNRIVEATAAFKQAVLNEPGNKTNHYILGVLHRTTGDFTDAISEFKEALKIDPAYGDALFDLGATYYNWGVDILKAAQDKGEENVEYKEKFKEALPYLEQVTQIKPDDAQVWETLGTIYARLGQADKAQKALDQADKIRQGK